MIIEGKALKYEDNNINTDAIWSGRRTYIEIPPEEMINYAMENYDSDFKEKVKNYNIFVAGKNFGCGSSREHAPIALSHSGIKAVLAFSFARIFYRNSVDGAFLLPIEIDEEAYKNIANGDELNISVETNEIKNVTKNQTYQMKPFSEIIGKIIAAGGLFKFKP